VYRLKLIILLAMFAIAPAWAQDDVADSEAEATGEETAESVEEVTDEEVEALLGLDEDYSEIEDDDFKSTLEVGFGQSIPFPTDI